MALSPPESETVIEVADFMRYFPHTPAALCIRECGRLHLLRRYACPSPILDVGCGDGLFASIAFADAEVWGIDIDAKEGRWAAASQAYSQIVLGDVTQAKLPEAFFATCIANCSLEHVPRLDLALHTILKSLKPGGRFLTFLPNRDWAKHLLSYRVLSALGAQTVADTLREGLDAFFKHHHLHDTEGWRKVVTDVGFEVEVVEPVLLTASTVAFEAFLLPSMLGWVNKHLTTRWTNFPMARRAMALPVYAAARAIIESGDPTPTCEVLVVARKPGG